MIKFLIKYNISFKALIKKKLICINFKVTNFKIYINFIFFSLMVSRKSNFFGFFF